MISFRDPKMMPARDRKRIILTKIILAKRSEEAESKKRDCVSNAAKVAVESKIPITESAEISRDRWLSDSEFWQGWSRSVRLEGRVEDCAAGGGQLLSVEVWIKVLGQVWIEAWPRSFEVRFGLGWVKVRTRVSILAILTILKFTGFGHHQQLLKRRFFSSVKCAILQMGAKTTQGFWDLI